MTPKALKIALSLCGGKRLPHLEDEIFKKKQLVILYLVSMSDGFLTEDDLKRRNEAYWFTYFHAKAILKTRWENAEEFLKKIHMYGLAM